MKQIKDILAERGVVAPIVHATSLDSAFIETMQAEAEGRRAAVLFRSCLMLWTPERGFEGMFRGAAPKEKADA